MTNPVGTLSESSYNVDEKGTGVQFALDESKFAVAIKNNGPSAATFARYTNHASGEADNSFLAVGQTVSVVVGGYIVFQTAPGEATVVTMSAAYLGP